MQGSNESVLVEVMDSIAHLTLNNAARKNAITLEMAAGIEDFCGMVERDESIGAVIVDAAGSYFCSGADTRDLAASSNNPASPEAVARTSAVYSAFVRVGNLPTPSLSVVIGGAVGAGLNLAMATDLMVVTPDALLDSGFLARHIHPGGGHLSLMGRGVGYANTVAMSAFGIPLSGEEAVRRGLAYDYAPESEIHGLARSLVTLAASDPQLARRIKNSTRLELGPPAVPWASALEIERGVQMWSLGRKGEEGWKNKPVKPAPRGQHR